MNETSWSALSTYVETRLSDPETEVPRGLALACAGIVAEGSNKRRLEKIRSAQDDDRLAELRSELTGAAAAAGTIGMRVSPRLAREWLAVFACTHPDPHERLRTTARYAWEACRDEDQRTALAHLIYSELG